MKFALVLVGGLLVAGCASKPEEIRASYVSDLIYGHHTCKQLMIEAERISARVVELSGAQDSQRTKDIVATTAGLILFSPILLAVKGDNMIAAELARMKGEMEAIEKASIQKKCNIQFKKTEKQPELVVE